MPVENGQKNQARGCTEDAYSDPPFVTLLALPLGGFFPGTIIPHPFVRRWIFPGGGTVPCIRALCQLYLGRFVSLTSLPLPGGRKA